MRMQLEGHSTIKIKDRNKVNKMRQNKFFFSNKDDTEKR